MGDNKNKKDARDRNQVAAGQPYEIDYLIKELGVSRQEIDKAIKAVGNDRKKIKEYLLK